MDGLYRFHEHETLPELDENPPDTQRVTPDPCIEIDITPVSENHEVKHYINRIEEQSRQLQAARALLKNIRYFSNDINQVYKIADFFKMFPDDP